MSRIKSGFTAKKYFKLKDGTSTFRILPPMEEMGNKGKGKDWSKFYKVHYGYKNSDGKLRVFQSSLVENRKTKMIEVPDAAVQRIKDLKGKLEEAKEAGNKAVVEKLGKLVSGQKPMYNLDGNHYVNAIDSQGNLGVLKLRHRAMKALEDEIKKLEKKGIDPLDLKNGREFVFTRSGSGLDTSFKVDVGQEELNIDGVGKVNRDKVSSVSEDVLSRTDSECADLSKLFKAVSSEDIERIVKSSDLLTGISPVIDELFDTKGDGGDEGQGDAGDDGDDTGSADSGSQAAAADNSAAEAAAAKQAADAKAAADSKAKADADAKAKVEALKAEAAKNEAAKEETKAAASRTGSGTTAEAVGEMDDAEFLKSLGL
jgi:uncharacterized ParB-like nuclease family protein